MNLVFCVLVVLTGSSQTRGQTSVLPPVPTLTAPPAHAVSSASPDLTEDPGNSVLQQTHNPAGGDETPAQTTTMTEAEGTAGHSETETNAAHEMYLSPTSSSAPTSQHTDIPVVMTAHYHTSSPSAAADGLSSTPTAQSIIPLHHLSTTASVTTGPLTAFSSQPAPTVQDVRTTAHTSVTQAQPESLTTAITLSQTTGHAPTSAPGRRPAGPTHRDVPSELNVGDEDLKGPRIRPNSPLDPLMAGLLSVFIVTTAIVFVVLFLKFRQRTNHPEFHRLQDLPMDDLMEDTPLSRYTY